MIPMADFWLAVDVAIGWILGRAIWLAAQELLIKPLLIRLYQRADAAAGDRLPDLP
jgi:hypothetical protein